MFVHRRQAGRGYNSTNPFHHDGESLRHLPPMMFLPMTYLLYVNAAAVPENYGISPSQRYLEEKDGKTHKTPDHKNQDHTTKNSTDPDPNTHATIDIGIRGFQESWPVYEMSYTWSHCARLKATQYISPSTNCTLRWANGLAPRTSPTLSEHAGKH